MSNVESGIYKGDPYHQVSPDMNGHSGSVAVATIEHELMQSEPHQQFDPGVLEVGGLVPSVTWEPGQSC